MPEINLTPDEEKNLSLYNATAYDLLRTSDKRVQPCWLVLSEEARKEAREGLRAFLAGRGFTVPTVEDAEAFVLIHMERQHESIVRRWRAAELACKRARIEGDPSAFFAG